MRQIQALLKSLGQSECAMTSDHYDLVHTQYAANNCRVLSQILAVAGLHYFRGPEHISALVKGGRDT